MRRPAAKTREHVVDVIQDLFYWQGIRAIGVDRIAAEAHVAPTTLYRLFASKDDMIAAYVHHNEVTYREWFTTATKADGRSARERILAVFDALAEQVQPELCRGCPFMMTLAEFPDPALPANRNAISVKTWVRDRFRELAAELVETPEEDPTVLADQLVLIMDGVYGSVQSLGSNGPARRARALVELALDATTRSR